MPNLTKMLAPNSVAVIGASRREGSLGKMFLDAILQMNFKGKLYPVNPKAEEINGVKCYASIEQLPETPDLSVILLPKDFVLSVMEELGKKGAKNVVVISAGFREVGGKGVERENALVNLAIKYNMNLIGPNSMGLFNTNEALSLNATFSPTPPIKGHIGFVSQSGALGVAVLELSLKRQLGFSIFVSTGNKAGIGDAEILDFLKNDENTRAVILYQESIDDPVEYRKICREVAIKKPVLILKAGRTKSGLKAASSHTGALASDDVIVDEFLKQCGAIRCQTLEEMLDSAFALVNQPLPNGNRVAVVTNAGGPGILASDAVENAGLLLAELDEQTKNELKAILPAEAAVNNPVDMIASANHQTYRDVCTILAKDKNVDSVLFIIVKPPINATPRMIISEMTQLISKSEKPFICTLMAQQSNDAGLDVFRKLSVPVFEYPEQAAKVLGNMVGYSKLKAALKETGTLRTIKERKAVKEQKIMQESFSNISKLLKNYQLPVSEFIIAKNAEQAVGFQKTNGIVALKIANEQIIHKSDLGLVKLNINSASQCRESFEEIFIKSKQYLPKDINPQILVQKMAGSGVELVLGARRDPNFGPVIMFGIGGVLIELYKDVVFRVLPVDLNEVNEMINEIRGKKILDGFRNFPKYDKKTLVKFLVRFAKMIEENDYIEEMDLNPLIWPADEKQPVIVDYRMTRSI